MSLSFFVVVVRLSFVLVWEHNFKREFQMVVKLGKKR